MKKRKVILGILITTILIVLSLVSVSAIIDLSNGYWETTYDCAEWTQSQGNPSCDGVAKYGEWKNGC